MENDREEVKSEIGREEMTRRQGNRMVGRKAEKGEIKRKKGGKR